MIVRSKTLWLAGLLVLTSVVGLTLAQPGTAAKLSQQPVEDGARIRFAPTTPTVIRLKATEDAPAPTKPKPVELAKEQPAKIETTKSETLPATRFAPPPIPLATAPQNQRRVTVRPNVAKPEAPKTTPSAAKQVPVPPVNAKRYAEERNESKSKVAVTSRARFVGPVSTPIEARENVATSTPTAPVQRQPARTPVATIKPAPTPIAATRPEAPVRQQPAPTPVATTKPAPPKAVPTPKASPAPAQTAAVETKSIPLRSVQPDRPLFARPPISMVPRHSTPPAQRQPKQPAITKAAVEMPRTPLVVPEHPEAAAAAGMIVVSQRVDEHTRYAFELARRGATFAAEAQLTQALKLVAQALDAETGGDEHYQALARGLRAFEEGGDFVDSGPDLIALRPIAKIAATHKTDVLSDQELATIDPFTALQRYYNYGREQLAKAAGGQKCASRALYGMGRVHAYHAWQKSKNQPLARAKSTAFYQASIVVDRANHMAANELSVMLFRYGRVGEARAMLEQSVAMSPQPETMHNLAKIYDRQGLARQAEGAMKYAQHMKKSKGKPNGARDITGRNLVRWVSHDEFADQPAYPDSMPQIKSAPPKQAPVVAATPKESSSSPVSALLAKVTTRRKPVDRGAAPVRRTSIQQEYPDGLEVVPGLEVDPDAQLNRGLELFYRLPPPQCAIHGVQCRGCCGEAGWGQMGPIPWQMFAQGEYIGPARLRHVPEYRLRVDDDIQFVYRLDGIPSENAYEIEVGDQVRIESLTAPENNRDVIVQPDGKISLRLLGQVRAAGRTLDDLRDELDDRYSEQIQLPAISITPLQINTTANQLIATVNRRFGQGGQGIIARVTPAGTVQLPAIGSVPAQGLTLAELRYEIERRYRSYVSGLEVTPVLAERAPRFVYVVGEVAIPGRYELVAPTTTMQAIALAGSWNNGAHLNNIVVFRRDQNWQLMATKLDLHGALHGKRPCPSDEIWLRDSDIVLVPKSPVLVADDVIELIFTRGLYGVVPLDFSINFARLTTL